MTCIYEKDIYNSFLIDAGWSSLVARRAHNPKVVGSNPAPATKYNNKSPFLNGLFAYQFFMGNDLYA